MIDYKTCSRNVKAGKPFTSYFSRFTSDGQAQGAAARVDNPNGARTAKRCYQCGVEGGKLVAGASGGAFTVPYIAGAWSDSDSVPTIEEGLKVWESIARADLIAIVEGEKCAEAVRYYLRNASRPVAVLTAGGCKMAAKWNEWGSLIRDYRARHGVAAFCPVFILGDNDKPGRKAANETASGFMKAGFENVVYKIVDKRPDQTDAPRGYDIADYFDELNEQAGDDSAALHRFDFLYSQAAKYERAQSSIDAAAIVARALKAQEEQDQAARELLEDKSSAFDLERVPGVLARPARAIADKFAAPVMAVLTAELAAFGGFLGAYRFHLGIRGAKYYPVLASVVVGKSGSGKTPLLSVVTDPIFEIMRREEEEASARRQEAPALERQRAALLEQEKKLRAKLTNKQQEEARKLAKNGAADSRDSVDTLNEFSEYEEAAAVDTDVAKLARLIDHIKRLDVEINARNAGGQWYLQDYKSSQGLKLALQQNIERAASLRAAGLGGIPNGSIMFSDEAAPLYSVSRSPQSLSQEWAALNQLIDFKGITKGMTVTHESATITRASCAALFGVQPSACTFIKYGILRGNGFANRSLWAFFPLSDVDNRVMDIDAELKEWGALIEAAYNMPSTEFTASTECEARFEGYAADMAKLKKTASDRGDDDKSAYLAKAASLTAQVALVFHIARILDPRDDLGKEYKETGDAAAIPSVIDVDELENAISFVSAAIEERDKVWRILYETHKLTLADQLERDKKIFGAKLSPAAQRVLKLFATTPGEVYSATGEVEEEHDHVKYHFKYNVKYKILTVEDIRSRVAAYKTAARRALIDEELNKNGLLTLKPKRSGQKGESRRVLLSDWEFSDLDEEEDAAPYSAAASPVGAPESRQDAEDVETVELTRSDVHYHGETKTAPASSSLTREKKRAAANGLLKDHLDEVRDALKAAGWKEWRRSGDDVLFTRPERSGEDSNGALAVEGERLGRFYVNTSKEPGFDGEKPYSPLETLARAKFNGDEEEATRYVLDKYGRKAPRLN